MNDRINEVVGSVCFDFVVFVFSSFLVFCVSSFCNVSSSKIKAQPVRRRWCRCRRCGGSCALGNCKTTCARGASDNVCKAARGARHSGARTAGGGRGRPRGLHIERQRIQSVRPVPRKLTYIFCMLFFSLHF